MDTLGITDEATETPDAPSKGVPTLSVGIATLNTVVPGAELFLQRLSVANKLPWAITVPS
jgi:hypothetical protein